MNGLTNVLLDAAWACHIEQPPVEVHDMDTISSKIPLSYTKPHNFNMSFRIHMHLTSWDYFFAPTLQGRCTNTAQIKQWYLYQKYFPSKVVTNGASCRNEEIYSECFKNSVVITAWKALKVPEKWPF